ERAEEADADIRDDGVDVTELREDLVTEAADLGAILDVDGAKAVPAAEGGDFGSEGAEPFFVDVEPRDGHALLCEQQRGLPAHPLPEPCDDDVLTHGNLAIRVVEPMRRNLGRGARTPWPRACSRRRRSHPRGRRERRARDPGSSRDVARPRSERAR